jgi:hypothetical protein
MILLRLLPWPRLPVRRLPWSWSGSPWTSRPQTRTRVLRIRCRITQVRCRITQNRCRSLAMAPGSRSPWSLSPSPPPAPRRPRRSLARAIPRKGQGGGQPTLQPLPQQVLPPVFQPVLQILLRPPSLGRPRCPRRLSPHPHPPQSPSLMLTSSSEAQRSDACLRTRTGRRWARSSEWNHPSPSP